jgi:hypothetical protein
MLRAGVTAVIAAGAVAAGLAGPALAAGPAPGGWRMVDLPQPGGRVIEVAAAGGVQWAVVTNNSTEKTTVWANSGSGWSQTRLPVYPPFDLGLYLRAGSAADVWAFVPYTSGRSDGPAGFDAVHWNGAAWSSAGSFANPDGGGSVNDAVVLGPADVWVFSAPGVRGTGAAWHWNGSAWSRVSAPGTGLSCGSALSPSSIWACDGSAVAHWNGSSWTLTSVASMLLPADGSLDVVKAIVAESPDNVYAVGGGNAHSDLGPVVVLHWDGRAWTRIVSYGFGTITPFGVAGDGHGGLWWMTGPVYPAVLHWTGGKLIDVSLLIPIDAVDLYSLARTSAAGAMLLGGQLRSGAFGPVLVESSPGRN